MKNKLLGFLLGVVCLPSIANTNNSVLYDIEVIRVIDGDTIVYKADYLPKPLKPELSVRVYGVDTPEKGHRAACSLEQDNSKTATEFTRKQIANAKRVQLQLIGWDKFGGRVLGDIVLDGESLRKRLIESGIAREYYGKAKQSWCN